MKREKRGEMGSLEISRRTLTGKGGKIWRGQTDYQDYENGEKIISNFVLVLNKGEDGGK